MAILRVFPTLELYRPTPGAIPIVIDVLRATTCIAAALQAGARELLPCLTPEEALGSGADLFAGERGALPIPGFSLGNSPGEYTPERVANRRIALTTTNGTRALRATPSGHALCAALVNRSAVAQSVSGDVDILCAGTDGCFSADDWACAGALVQALPDGERDDGAQAALAWFVEHADDLQGMLGRTRHGQRLLSLGLHADLELCSQGDLWDVVPELRGGAIRAR